MTHSLLLYSTLGQFWKRMQIIWVGKDWYTFDTWTWITWQLKHQWQRINLEALLQVRRVIKAHHFSMSWKRQQKYWQLLANECTRPSLEYQFSSTVVHFQITTATNCCWVLFRISELQFQPGGPKLKLFKAMFNAKTLPELASIFLLCGSNGAVFLMGHVFYIILLYFNNTMGPPLICNMCALCNTGTAKHHSNEIIHRFMPGKIRRTDLENEWAKEHECKMKPQWKDISNWKWIRNALLIAAPLWCTFVSTFGRCVSVETHKFYAPCHWRSPGFDLGLPFLYPPGEKKRLS